MNEMTSVATNGSWVRTMVKISAGSNGARRGQFAELVSGGLLGSVSPASLRLSTATLMSHPSGCPGLPWRATS